MPPTRPGRIRAARRAVEDVGILFRFRAQAVRRRHLSRGLAATFVLVTLAVATVPAFMPGANGPGKAFDVFLLLPSAMAGILALNIASAVASGGGRELLSRDQASPYPISPTTDHLGALLLAPFNIAWMIQAWVLFGSMAYSYAGNKLFQAQVAMLLWLVFCTTLGQVVAWTMEAVRRGPYGIGITRGLLICLALGCRRGPADRARDRGARHDPDRVGLPGRGERLGGALVDAARAARSSPASSPSAPAPCPPTSPRAGCRATRRAWRPTSTSPARCRGR